MEQIIVDILGWIGSILLVGAYWLISQNKVQASSPSYQWLNLIGSLLLIVNTLYYGAYPSSALNVVWAAIGVAYLMRSKQKNEASAAK